MIREISINGHRLVAACSDDLAVLADSLLAKLAQLHARGPRLHPGSIIEFGWAPLRIEEDESDWVVCEPDFGDEEMARFVPGVDTTLRVLDQQARIHRSLGIPAQVTRFDQSVLVAEEALEASRAFLDRAANPPVGDSGWYAGIDEEGHPLGKATRIPAGRLTVLRPEWMCVLALPSGFLATFENQRLISIYDERSREVACFDRGSDK